MEARVEAAAEASPRWLDAAAILICTAAWGTTWFAITKQFGVVDPVVSIVYRFTLAAALLFAWCALRGERIALSKPQHGAALGVGLFTFAFDYALVYWAEERVTSAITITVPRQLLADLRARIDGYRHDLFGWLLERQAGLTAVDGEVVQVNLQMFRLTDAAGEGP